MSPREPIGYEVVASAIEGRWSGRVVYVNDYLMMEDATTYVYRSKKRAERRAKRLFEKRRKAWEWVKQEPTRIIPKGEKA